MPSKNLLYLTSNQQRYRLYNVHWENIRISLTWNSKCYFCQLINYRNKILWIFHQSTNRCKSNSNARGQCWAHVRRGVVGTEVSDVVIKVKAFLGRPKYRNQTSLILIWLKALKIHLRKAHGALMKQYTMNYFLNQTAVRSPTFGLSNQYNGHYGMLYRDPLSLSIVFTWLIGLHKTKMWITRLSWGALWYIISH